jgi:hypothetical protein
MFRWVDLNFPSRAIMNLVDVPCRATMNPVKYRGRAARKMQCQD